MDGDRQKEGFPFLKFWTTTLKSANTVGGDTVNEEQNINRERDRKTENPFKQSQRYLT